MTDVTTEKPLYDNPITSDDISKDIADLSISSNIRSPIGISSIRDQQITAENFLLLSHSFLPNIIVLKQEADEVEYQTKIDEKGKLITTKRIKQPISALKAIKKSEPITNKNNVSRHDKKEDHYISYDAYIKLNDIDQYRDNNEKQAFVDIQLRSFKGYIGSELDIKNSNLIVKHTLYNGLMQMIRIANYRWRNTNLKLHPVTYYLVDSLRVSSKEFKLMNFPRSTSKENIEKAIFKAIKSSRFFIKKSGLKPNNNLNTMTMYFTVQDAALCKIAKNIWSVVINQHFYRMVPAHGSMESLSSRKYFCGEFIGFDDTHLPSIALDIFVA